MSANLPKTDHTGHPTLPMSGPPADAPAPTPPASAPQDLPAINVVRRNALLSGVASNVKQDVLLICDRSGSMSGFKISELNEAVQACRDELARPENKDGFLMSVIHFNGSANRIHFRELATRIQITPARAGGGTNFDAALKEARRVIDDAGRQPNAAGWHYLKPVAIHMSDGFSVVAQKNIDALHEVAEVIAVAYGEDADRETLARIASDGQVHVVGTNGGELRQFLADVGKTISETFQNQVV